jgi:hypothetical protein
MASLSHRRLGNLGVLAVQLVTKPGFADERFAGGRRRLGKPIKEIPNAIPLARACRDAGALRKMA